MEITKIRFSLKKQVNKISKKISLKSEQLAYCTQKAVNSRAPAVKNPESVGNGKPDEDEI